MVFITTVIVKKGEGILQHNFAHKYTILKKSIIIDPEEFHIFSEAGVKK